MPNTEGSWVVVHAHNLPSDHTIETLDGIKKEFLELFEKSSMGHAFGDGLCMLWFPWKAEDAVKFGPIINALKVRSNPTFSFAFHDEEPFISD